MKKCVGFILCIALLCFCLSGFAETELQYANFFDPEMTRGFASAYSINARKYMQDEQSRSAFTCLLMLDFFSAVGKGEIESPPFEMTLLDNVSYVGRDGISLYLFILSQDKKQALVYVYKDSSTNAGCFLSDIGSQYMAEIVLEGLCPDGYYKNDAADLYQTSMILKDAFDQ